MVSEDVEEDEVVVVYDVLSVLLVAVLVFEVMLELAVVVVVAVSDPVEELVFV